MDGFCRGFCTAALIVAAAAFSAVGTAWAAEPPSVIVVVDHSRSMWGPLEGSKQGKYLLVREALRAGMRKMGSQTRVGLASFGHRRLDCGDVEVVRPPEPVDIERLMTPLDQLTPRGTGPLTLALREAAKALPKEAGSRTLILIHDDADNCQVDLCTAAAELKAAGITAHAIGLGAKAADLAKMACLPQATGGRYFNAVNAEQVASHVEEALRQSGIEVKSAEPPAADQAAPAVVPPAPIPASGPTALYLRAIPAPNTEPLGAALHWTVAAEARPELLLFDARAANPTVPVAPGRYIVEARDGPVAARQIVEARDNRPIAVTVTLNAGAVRIRALAQKTSGLLADAIVSVSDAGGSLVSASKTGEISALLPAGRFVARVELGLLRAEQAVTVTAGRQVNLDIPLNAGRLQLTTSAREPGTALEPTIFSVVEDDPDAPQGRRELVLSAAQQADFVLPPGTYYVIARQGFVEARERLAIGPGDVIKRSLNPALGRLSLSTKIALANAPANEPITYSVIRLDGGEQEIATTSAPAPTLALPSGRYRVEARYGLMNARSVREVEMKAGQAQQLVLDPQVALLRLRLVGTAPSDIWWDIRGDSGTAVWTDGQAEPAATLQAGRYLVRVETRDKRYERAVDLRAGEVRLLEIPAD